MLWRLQPKAQEFYSYEQLQKAIHLCLAVNYAGVPDHDPLEDHLQHSHHVCSGYAMEKLDTCFDLLENVHGLTAS